jgi:hypothetical protein
MVAFIEYNRPSPTFIPSLLKKLMDRLLLVARAIRSTGHSMREITFLEYNFANSV